MLLKSVLFVPSQPSIVFMEQQFVIHAGHSFGDKLFIQRYVLKIPQFHSTNTRITVYEMQRKQQLFSQAMGETRMQLVSLPKVS